MSHTSLVLQGWGDEWPDSYEKLRYCPHCGEKVVK